MSYDEVMKFIVKNSNKCLNLREAVNLIFESKASPDMKLSFIGHCISAKTLSSTGFNEDAILATAFTEPKGGSSLRTLETIVNGFGRVSGTKYFVTNGAFATHYLVLAQKRTGEHVLLLVKRGKNVIVEKLPLIVYENSGISKVVFRNTQAEQVFREGKESYVKALEGLVYGRVLISALAISLGFEILNCAIEWASKRIANGVSLLEHEIIEQRIADAYARLSTAKLYVAKVSSEDRISWINSSIAKYLSVKYSCRAVESLIKVFGGYAFLKTANIIPKYLHIMALEPAEGTSDIQLKIIMKSILREKSKE
ncbi:MAG: hypothetical protein B6U76_02240 [Desulfurococcales archaeon ex4484_217_2]|nr:MAG: hypothetical protein B6U76_02240 [Desulfurococcales archaeon ex4484_217_2]